MLFRSQREAADIETWFQHVEAVTTKRVRDQPRHTCAIYIGYVGDVFNRGWPSRLSEKFHEATYTRWVNSEVLPPPGRKRIVKNQLGSSEAIDTLSAWFDVDRLWAGAGKLVGH